MRVDGHIKQRRKGMRGISGVGACTSLNCAEGLSNPPAISAATTPGLPAGYNPATGAIVGSNNSAATTSPSQLNNLPLSGEPGGTNYVPPLSTVTAPSAPPLACPTGYTCTIAAGIPDIFIYGGIAIGVFALLSMIGGRR